GDYVSFDGTSTATEGTVVALTLRATKVRTPSGEVVMIPNGSAGVVTNYSQEWSRAVVNFDVPVRSGENIDDIHRTIEETAKQAIKDPSISEDVAGEVEILPATALTSPTAAGQPWRVNFRVLVVVNPARQWAVERGIRAALLNVFWDHFRTPFESPKEEFTREMGVASLSDAPTETIPVDPSSSEAASTVEDTQDAAEAAARDEKADEDIAPAAKDDGPGRPSTTVAADADAEPPVKSNPKRRDFWRTDAYDKRWKKALSFGGRIRPSTTVLLMALLLTGGLALASSNPEDGNAGVLSPAYWQQRSAAESSEVETTEEEPVETPATEPSYQPQPEPSLQPEPTDEQNPEGFSQNQEQLDTGASTEQSPAPSRDPQSVVPQDSQGTQGTAESSPNDADATSGTDNFQVP